MLAGVLGLLRSLVGLLARVPHSHGCSLGLIHACYRELLLRLLLRCLMRWGLGRLCLSLVLSEMLRVLTLLILARTALSLSAVWWESSLLLEGLIHLVICIASRLLSLRLLWLVAVELLWLLVLLLHTLRLGLGLLLQLLRLTLCLGSDF